jgi:hypothetical protein
MFTPRRICAFCVSREEGHLNVRLVPLCDEREVRPDSEALYAHIVQDLTVQRSAARGFLGLSKVWERAVKLTKGGNGRPSKRECALYIRQRAREVAAIEEKSDGNRRAEILKQFPCFQRIREDLYKKLLDPVLPRRYLERLHIGGQSEFYRFPFYSLLVKDETTLLDSLEVCYFVPRYPKKFVREESNKFVREESNSGASPPLVLSDPNYNLKEGHKKLSAETLRAMAAKCSLGQAVGQISYFQKLIYGKEEGAFIEKILDAERFAGDRANKKNVLAVRSPLVLHFATHAFIFAEPEGEARSFGILPLFQDLELEKQGFAWGPVTDPYLRAGLALAGANWRWSHFLPPPAAGDGTLTAREILGMDLSHTKLVVLSACDTGRGEAMSGRALAGLTEAFLLAGAQCVVSSLWKVADEETLQLMKWFYEDFAEGAPVGRALTSAKRRMKEKYPEEACLWSCFQCFGDSSVRLRG